MEKRATACSASRHHPRLAALAALFLGAGLLLVPRLTHPDQTMPRPTVSNGAGKDLVALITAMDAIKPTPEATGASALRRPATPREIRLPVDKHAVHPLDYRLAVRTGRLGATGSGLRVKPLAAVEPPAAPVKKTSTELAVASPPKPLPVPAKPQAAPAVASTRAVTPATVAAAAPAPVSSRAAAPIAASAPAPAMAPNPAVAPASAALPGRAVLVVGDSLSLFLADALEPRLARRPGTAFAKLGKVSSGLARPDFFNWEATLTALAGKHRPDTLVIMIAANDNKTMARPGGGMAAFGRPGWDEEYGRRVQRLIDIARENNPACRVYWVGAPIMADANLTADLKHINAVIRAKMQANPGCTFVDTWSALADASGRYTAALPGEGGARTVRTKDGVHLTPTGARILADACLAAMAPSLAMAR